MINGNGFGFQREGLIRPPPSSSTRNSAWRQRADGFCSDTLKKTTILFGQYALTKSPRATIRPKSEPGRNAAGPPTTRWLKATPSCSCRRLADQRPTPFPILARRAMELIRGVLRDARRTRAPIDLTAIPHERGRCASGDGLSGPG